MSRREACTFLLAFVGLALPACHNANSTASPPAVAVSTTPVTASAQSVRAQDQPAAACGSAAGDHEACKQLAPPPAACGAGDAHPHAACGEAACAHTEHANAESCGDSSQPTAAQAAAPEPQDRHEVQPAPSTLTRIAASGGVCMLSNRYLGERADVPIDVDGKTYHGCCANCAARLGMQEEARMATDPVTGRPVDKASAVLAHDANNRLFYFESESTLAQYSAR